MHVFPPLSINRLKNLFVKVPIKGMPLNGLSDSQIRLYIQKTSPKTDTCVHTFTYTHTYTHKHTHACAYIHAFMSIGRYLIMSATNLNNERTIRTYWIKHICDRYFKCLLNDVLELIWLRKICWRHKKNSKWPPPPPAASTAHKKNMAKLQNFNNNNNYCAISPLVAQTQTPSACAERTVDKGEQRRVYAQTQVHTNTHPLPQTHQKVDS